MWQLMTARAEMRRRRHPLRGAWIGFGTGLLFLLLAGASDARYLAEMGLTRGSLSVIYLSGGFLGGLVGGVLWPYQRTRLETLVFAVPTAVPMYLLAGFAMGISVQVSLWAALVSALLYSLFYGGANSTGHGGARERGDTGSKG